MELELIRTYHPGGTNGVILYNQLPVCYTIELPWKENKLKISCIPEGRYALTRRYSRKFKEHFLVKNVPRRWYILIHPANNALHELEGCIAPVLLLDGDGQGRYSKVALGKLLALTEKAFQEKEAVFLTIKSTSNENGSEKNESADT
jgi:hypothetical protein